MVYITKCKAQNKSKSPRFYLIGQWVPNYKFKFAYMIKSNNIRRNFKNTIKITRYKATLQQLTYVLKKLMNFIRYVC